MHDTCEDLKEVQQELKVIKDKTILVDDLKTNQDAILAALEDIRNTQKITAESLERIFSLYESHTEELEKGSREFRKIREFMVEKRMTNGYTKDTINEMKIEIDNKASKESYNRVEEQIKKANSGIDKIKDYLFTSTEKQKEKAESKLSENQKLILGMIIAVIVSLASASLLKII